jgi:hypothetical protein
VSLNPSLNDVIVSFRFLNSAAGVKKGAQIMSHDGLTLEGNDFGVAGVSSLQIPMQFISNQATESCTCCTYLQ